MVKKDRLLMTVFSLMNIKLREFLARRPKSLKLGITVINCFSADDKADQHAVFVYGIEVYFVLNHISVFPV